MNEGYLGDVVGRQKAYEKECKMWGRLMHIFCFGLFLAGSLDFFFNNNWLAVIMSELIVFGGAFLYHDMEKAIRVKYFGYDSTMFDYPLTKAVLSDAELK